MHSVRAISSVGSEHLPYKQGVIGSTPVSPTVDRQELTLICCSCFFFGSVQFSNNYLPVNK